MPFQTPSDTEIQAILKRLADTPRQVTRVARGVSTDELHRKPTPDAWSAHEILAHLQACAEVWGGSIDRMLTEEHPTIRYVSPRSWIRKTDFLEQDFRTLLDRFAIRRKALLETLTALEATGWTRRATVTGTTRGRDATVLVYATRIADHEVHHLPQFRRAIQP